MNDPTEDALALLSEDLLELTRHVVEQADELARLRMMLAQRPSSATGFVLGIDELPMPFIWNELDPNDAEQTMIRLNHWVQWLVNRYRLDDHIPECWAHHGAFTEELTALWIAWETAYRQPPNPDAATRWHNELGWLLNRITTTWKRQSCPRGSHSESLTAWASPYQPTHLEGAPRRT